MQYSPTFHVMALSAQQREFDLVRFDGPAVVERPAGRFRAALTRGLSHRLSAPRTARRHATA
jgi:hypothetical protein